MPSEIHNEFGQIEDPQLAREMADAQNSGRSEARRIELNAEAGEDPKEAQRNETLERYIKMLHIPGQYRPTEATERDSQFGSAELAYSTFGEECARSIIWSDLSSAEKYTALDQLVQGMSRGYADFEAKKKIHDYYSLGLNNNVKRGPFDAYVLQALGRLAGVLSRAENPQEAKLLAQYIGMERNPADAKAGEQEVLKLAEPAILQIRRSGQLHSREFCDQFMGKPFIDATQSYEVPATSEI